MTLLEIVDLKAQQRNVQRMKQSVGEVHLHRDQRRIHAGQRPAVQHGEAHDLFPGHRACFQRRQPLLQLRQLLAGA